MSAALAWTRRRWASWAGERTRTELRLLAVILAIAVVLRFIWVLYAMREPQGIHDPIFYFGYGQAIAGGGGYQLPAVGDIGAGPTAYYPVGYSAALGVVFALVTHTPIPDNLTLTAGFFQLFLGVVTVAMVYEVGRRLFGFQVGLLAGLWVALFPNLIFHTATFLTETLFMFIVLAALLVLMAEDWRVRPPSLSRLVVFALLVGLSALVRPISLLLLPMVPLVWLLARFGWRRMLLDTGVVFFVAAAVIAPWTIRNVVQLDAAVIISTNLGDNLCMGHYAGAPGHFALPDSCFDSTEYAGLDRPGFEVQRNNDNIKKAINYALDHPVVELKLLSRKAFHLWEHDHDGLRAVESYGDDIFIDAGFRTVLERTADIYFFVTISIGGLGLFGLVRSPRDPRRLYLLLGLLAFAGIPLVFFGDARFHVPVMPLLVVPAAWVVVSLVAFLRKRYVS